MRPITAEHAIGCAIDGLGLENTTPQDQAYGREIHIHTRVRQHKVASDYVRPRKHRFVIHSHRQTDRQAYVTH